MSGNEKRRENDRSPITKHTPNTPEYLVKTLCLFTSCHDSIPTLHCSKAKGATLKKTLHKFTAIHPD